MSVKRLPSGKYESSIWTERKAKRKRKRHPTRREAEKWERENLVIRDREKTKRKYPELRTIEDVIESYCSSVNFTDTRPTTQKRYLGIFTVFSTWCAAHGYDLASFNPEKADEYGKYLRSKYEPGGVRLNLKTIFYLFQREVRKKNIETNPFADVKFPTVETKEPRFLSDGEVRALLSNCKDYQRDVFKILIYTGLRSGELLNLPPENIVNGKIIVKPVKDWKPKTRKSTRDVPIPEPIKPIIEKFLLVNSGKRYLISGDKRYNKSRLLVWYWKAIENVKDFDLSDTKVHSLRNTYGSLLFQRGVPIGHVSKLMGHSNISVTEKIYIGLQPKNYEDGAAKLNEIVFP